ncbi:hypothetical protein [Nocardia sp. 348MFTsu5.1]|uniref:hypothetical protein n=1 Tax=Nocardia sp. 348MFTsu5.1 TaxID=1172185 RepID=UPI00037F5A0D|nr:hypothetical protein [Nocardia sp. 348MFTsu5.1]
MKPSNLASYFADTEEVRFFTYVVKHELSIIDSTERALRQDRNPLDGVLRILDDQLPGR